MKNIFGSVSKDGEFESYGEISGDAFSYWAGGYAYASYIAVTGGGHRIDKKAELVAFNDNVNEGDLFATYKVELLLSEFPYPVQAIGFAPYEGAPLSSQCTADKQPASMTIYGTVDLETPTSEFLFYPAENHLVRSLLGMEELGQISLKGGSSPRNAPAIVDESEYADLPCETSTEGGAEIAFEPNGCTDFLLYCGGKPCAQFNLGRAKTAEARKTVMSKGGFYLPLGKSAAVADHPSEYYDVPEQMYASGARPLSGFDGCKFFTDPLYRHAGLCNGREFYIIDGETLGVHKGGSYSGDVMMCSDGEVVSVEGGTIEFHNSGKRIRVIDGQTVVLSVSDGYAVFVLGKNAFVIYKLTAEGLNQVISISGDAGSAQLFRANDYSVVLQNGTSRRIFTAERELSFSYSGFASIGSAPLSDGCYYGNGFMGSFLNYSRVACAKHGGRLCISDGALVYVGENGPVKLSGEFDFDDAAIAGSTAMFLKDGRLEFYKLGFGGIYVSVPYSGSVEVDARLYDSAANSVKLKIKKSGGS